MDNSYLKDKRVFVTGGEGFIGSHLVDALSNLGAYIGSLVLNTSDLSLFVDEPYRGSVTDREAVERAIARFQPDYVFHLAAQPIVPIAIDNPFDTIETNVRGTYNLLEACRYVGKRPNFIYMSTDKVYGETKDIHFGSNEHDSLNGVNHPYDASKVAADVLAQSYSLWMPVSIVRSGNVYGPGDRNFTRLIPYLCRQFAKNQPIQLRSTGSFLRDYIYIDDVISALLLLGKQDHPRAEANIYNLGSEYPYEVNWILDKLSQLSENSVRVEYRLTAHELKTQHMDSGKIRSLGWETETSITDGLSNTYGWYKALFDE